MRKPMLLEKLWVDRKEFISPAELKNIAKN